MNEFKVSEKSFQLQVIELAERLGWSVHAVRAARTKDGWRTPIQGLQGYPDLTMINPQKRRLLVVELKSEKGKLTNFQKKWIQMFQDCGIEAYVWKPADWDNIVEILKR